MKVWKKALNLKHIILLAAVILVPFLVASPRSMTARMVADSENGTKVMVLNYHKVDDLDISLSVRPKDFDDQMRYLKENGYHTITPDEFYESLAGNFELPENPVLITFDDGYEDNYRNAYPILRKYDFKATIFVISSFLGTKEHYFTWDQAREMAENGISIQSHTVDHN
ncbi:MAG: polysaccharide deacetylase family protein, partial [Selenomonadaceae bacterium]|nr:polysaccharide deacetylase family protein [Selenomonadaceae bacterium]